MTPTFSALKRTPGVFGNHATSSTHKSSRSIGREASCYSMESTVDGRLTARPVVVIQRLFTRCGEGKRRPYSMGIIDVHKGSDKPINENQVKAFIEKLSSCILRWSCSKFQGVPVALSLLSQFVTDAVNQRSSARSTRSALRRGHSGRAGCRICRREGELHPGR